MSGGGASLNPGVADPTELFMPLMNLQECRGIEGQRRRQRELGDGQRERMRAASLAGTNFALENIIAADEGEGLDTTLMPVPSDALIDELGPQMRSDADLTQQQDARPSQMKRSMLKLNIDNEAGRLDLFGDSRKRSHPMQQNAHSMQGSVATDDGLPVVHTAPNSFRNENIIDVSNMSVLAGAQIGLTKRDDSMIGSSGVGGGRE